MDFKDLPDEELWLQMQDDLYDGLKDEVVEETHEALRRGYGPTEVLAKGLVAGMDIVGVDFRDGVLFVPEVLMAANAMKAGMEILRPLLTQTGAPRIGTMVIGTVKGDIHDIGKNLVGMMMEGAGFEVIDLGINNSVEKTLYALIFECTAAQNRADEMSMGRLANCYAQFISSYFLIGAEFFEQMLINFANLLDEIFAPFRSFLLHFSRNMLFAICYTHVLLAVINSAIGNKVNYSGKVHFFANWNCYRHRIRPKFLFN